MKMSRKVKCLIGISSVVGFALVPEAFAEPRSQNGLITLDVTPAAGQAGSVIDYGNAKPVKMPTITNPPASAFDTQLNHPGRNPLFEQPGNVPGNPGNGQQTPVQLVPPRSLVEPTGAMGEVTPQEYGTSNHVYTTSTVNTYGNPTADPASKFYPYRAAGKLFFKIGTGSYVCSASLIKRGVVVTAAHCVSEYGKKRFYSNFEYVPAYNNGTAPYGRWGWANVTIKTAYYNGTDVCAVAGIVCQNDVAVITLAPQSGVYAGTRTGWLGYQWGGYGFNSANQALITQLGYPVALDGGRLMERTDSQGYVAPSYASNTVIGSLQTGGSSGGPWVANLGMAPVLVGTGFGAESAHNTVVGVTSWGYVSTAPKQMGASPFLSTNIQSLVNSACTTTPAACL